MKTTLSLFLMYIVTVSAQSLFNVPLGGRTNLFGDMSAQSQSLNNKLGLRTNFLQNGGHSLDGQIHGTHMFTPNNPDGVSQFGAGGLLNYQGRGQSGSLNVDKIPSGVQLGAAGSATIWRPNKNSHLDAIASYNQPFIHGNAGKPFFGGGLRYNF